MKISNLRKMSGVLLILVAVAGLVLWEAKGRELVLMTDVCAAESDIAQGERLDVSMFRAISVPRDSLVSGAVAPSGIAAAIGSGGVAAGFIPAGAMLSTSYIDTPDEISRREDSYFTIEREWIVMRSSALRRGDKAEILTADGARSFGVFDIGFVKGADDGEVEGTVLGNTGFGGGAAESRVDATSQIDHVEIVARLQDYLTIRQYAESVSGPSLLLVGKGIVK